MKIYGRETGKGGRVAKVIYPTGPLLVNLMW